MTNENHLKKYLSIPLRIVSVLLIISIVLLTTYLVSASLTKNSITKNLNPIISELSATPGATDVDVRICAEPGGFSMPWDMEFHVFLTVQFSHLGQLGDEKALEILNNGVELGETEYSYDSEDLDYALYTRSVTDSILGNSHPVFVTLTDGDKSYTIEEDSLFDKNILYMGDAYKVLNPPSSHQIITIFILSSLVFCGLFVLIVYKRIEKKREIKKAKREELEAVKKNDTTIGIDHILDEINDDISHSNEIQRKEKRKKLLLIGSSTAVALAVIAFLIVKLIVIPTNQYNKAVELRAAGNDAEAYTIFNSLGNFKDAKDICNAYDYADALAFIDEEHPETAFYLLNNMPDYEEAKNKATELLAEHPYFSILSAAPGDEVILGAYEQDNNASNGLEDIEWIVLKNENGVIYAVSKYILDAQVYNTHNGDGSTLKGWLKDDFNKVAFSNVPAGFISKVGLLSRDDMSVYHTIANTKPEWTAYAKAQDPESHYYAGYSWWLDGEYFHGYGDADVDMAVVIESGSYSNNVSSVTSVNGVRPAIIIDCVSRNIDYYTADYSDIDNAGVTTRTEADVQYITGNSGSGGNSTGEKCSRCSGTGRVTKHFGNSWNKKPGYGYGDVCGGCGGDGYK